MKRSRIEGISTRMKRRRNISRKKMKVMSHPRRLTLRQKQSRLKRMPSRRWP
jgi:hypothetical protein